MTDPLKGWDPQLEQGLPDSRLVTRRLRDSFVVGRMRFERVFCANCGADGGGVTEEWAAHVFYLCDSCSAKHGALPLPEIPESVVRGH